MDLGPEKSMLDKCLSDKMRLRRTESFNPVTLRLTRTAGRFKSPQSVTFVQTGGWDMAEFNAGARRMIRTRQPGGENLVRG